MRPDELVFGNAAASPSPTAAVGSHRARGAPARAASSIELRHGHGYALARSGVSQQMIMQSMGHRTLTASARYAHASVADKKAVIAKVFG